MAKIKNKVIGDIDPDIKRDNSFVSCTSCADFDSEEKEDNVNHPEHYTWLKDITGIEVIDITRHLDFDRGNAIKYILRCGVKEEGDLDKAIEDIEKAIWYLNDYKENFLIPIKQAAEEMEN